MTHNDLSHECKAINNWDEIHKEYKLDKDNIDVLFIDEIQFLKSDDTIKNVE